jgi:hypothetical protein
MGTSLRMADGSLAEGHGAHQHGAWLLWLACLSAPRRALVILQGPASLPSCYVLIRCQHPPDNLSGLPADSALVLVVYRRKILTSMIIEPVLHFLRDWTAALHTALCLSHRPLCSQEGCLCLVGQVESFLADEPIRFPAQFKCGHD